MPETAAVEEDGQEAAASPTLNGTADHGIGDHHSGNGEQNGIAEQNGFSHQGNSLVETPADKQPVTFLDHEVRSSVQQL